MRGTEDKVVFTNGCFDILHYGHLFLLKQASLLGNVLIVGVNSDDSVRKLKGPSRPIFPLEVRMDMLRELRCVTIVKSFEGLVPIALIKYLKPDIYVKGSDWKGKDIPEKKIVESGTSSPLIAPSGCGSDAECKGNRFCSNGRCEPRVSAGSAPGCVRDIDCVGDSICDDGRCQPPNP